MNSNHETRPMVEAGLASVLAIQSACYVEVAPESLQSLRSKLRASPGSCFGVSASGAVIGYLIALPWESKSPLVLNSEECVLPAVPDCLYLHDLAVAPAGRRVGAGGVLVTRFLKLVNDLRLPRATLIAVQGSAGYWERFGFRRVHADAALCEKIRSYGEGVAYMERYALVSER